MVKKFTVKGNGGNGIKVEAGAANTTLSENKAYSNGLNGYLILGTNTPMSKNIAGDIGTGNAGDGIRVVGNGGAISENTAKSNSLVGIRVTGTTHTLTKNKSGGTANQNNSSCQYVVGASNSNGGSNTSSNSATFTFTAAGAQLAGGLRAGPADTVGADGGVGAGSKGRRGDPPPLCWGPQTWRDFRHSPGARVAADKRAALTVAAYCAVDGEVIGPVRGGGRAGDL